MTQDIGSGEEPQTRSPSLSDFLIDPPRDLAAWEWLWRGDHTYPLQSHRGGLFGRLLVFAKRLFRPLVKVPQNDLWERQRSFNLILLENLQHREYRFRELRDGHHARLAYLETLHIEGITELMHHNDAVFARVDQKLDRYRRETRDLLGSLSAALALAEAAPAAERPAALSKGREEHAYLELERRYRGTEEEIGERISQYLPYLTGRGEILDLGCGRGESLALLQSQGIEGSGVDSSARMVGLCRERGLAASEGDLFEHLAAQPEGSLGGVVSFHVIEHLPAESLERLVRLAWRALKPGGVLILETPNPLSLVVAARNFWLDPTHRRPVHPESLRLHYELAGFTSIERLDLRPFAAADRLPEIDLAELPTDQHHLADQVNRLRDRLDELLFGFQDYGMVGVK